MKPCEHATPASRNKLTVDAAFNVWEGVYRGFAEATAIGPGFEGPTWRDRSLQGAIETLTQVENGESLDYSLRQRNALLPVVTATILGEQSRVRILDFGGGLGTGFLVLASTVSGAAERVDYAVVEVDCICRSGAELFAGRKGPTFHHQLPDVAAAADFDIVHAASTIQYIEDWRAMVARLATYGARYLSLSDIYIGDFPTYATLQNYYGSRIRHWFLNKGEFVSHVERCGYRLIVHIDCEMKVLGKHGPLPMNNFPEQLRIRHGSNLLFRKEK
jgi:putative methyltransferase (TIGR04325 family)